MRFSHVFVWGDRKQNHKPCLGHIKTSSFPLARGVGVFQRGNGGLKAEHSTSFLCSFHNRHVHKFLGPGC